MGDLLKWITENQETKTIYKMNAIVKIEFTADQEALIKKQIAPAATPDELKLFLYQCKRTGLDPLTRQIYCIHRGGKMTIQTSIDGFRVIAERSGTYAGQDEPIWEETNGKPSKCTVKVFKFGPDGQRYCAGVGVAYWSEYAQNSPMWAKMAHTMLAKCAEALALRKAFPQDLSGLYTSDEMQQAEPGVIDVEATEVKTYGGGVPTNEERALLVNLLYSSTLSDSEKEETLNWIREKCVNYKLYETLQMKLESRQQAFDTISNPSQKDITNHVAKIAK